MPQVLKSHAKKIGLPPGTLIPLGAKAQDGVKISTYTYGKEGLVDEHDVAAEKCFPLKDLDTRQWIDVRGIHQAETVQLLGQHFNLHTLVQEDILHAEQRCKLDDYQEILFIVMRMLTYSYDEDCLEDEQVSLVLGNNFVLSFLESDSDLFHPIYDRLRKEESRLRTKGADYLCYTLMDCVADHYFHILEQVDQSLENLEEELLEDPTPHTLYRIRKSKRSISLLRKSIWPTREVVNQFRKLESPLIQDQTRVYLQDVYDHVIQAIDSIENFRDITAGMLDIYLSNMSQKMNEIMKLLTIVATIFVPLTFISSLYGMNFVDMPELHWKWGYPAILSVMLATAGCMLYFFRRKKWI